MNMKWALELLAHLNASEFLPKELRQKATIYDQVQCNRTREIVEEMYHMQVRGYTSEQFQTVVGQAERLAERYHTLVTDDDSPIVRVCARILDAISFMPEQPIDENGKYLLDKASIWTTSVGQLS
jgi:hypothetical protein